MLGFFKIKRKSILSGDHVRLSFGPSVYELVSLVCPKIPTQEFFTKLASSKREFL